MASLHSSKTHITLAFVSCVIALGVASPVAAATIQLQGASEAYNSNGQLHFSGFNSNVTIDTQTGEFAGYAWSDDWGWVAFGTEDNEQGPVLLDTETGQVGGVAKVLNTNTFIDFADHNSNVTFNTETSEFGGHVFEPNVGWFHLASPGVTLASTWPTPTPTPTPTPLATPSPTPPSTGGGIDLPTTGSPMGDAAVAGSVLLGIGALMWWLRSRMSAKSLKLYEAEGGEQV